MLVMLNVTVASVQGRGWWSLGFFPSCINIWQWRRLEKKIIQQPLHNFLDHWECNWLPELTIMFFTDLLSYMYVLSSTIFIPLSYPSNVFKLICFSNIACVSNKLCLKQPMSPISWVSTMYFQNSLCLQISIHFLNKLFPNCILCLQ